MHNKTHEPALKDDPDSPELTEPELAAAKPFAEAFPALAERIRKAGRPKSDAPKEMISLRVERGVLEAYRSTGAGWQGRMHEALRAGAPTKP